MLRWIGARNQYNFITSLLVYKRLFNERKRKKRNKYNRRLVCVLSLDLKKKANQRKWWIGIENYRAFTRVSISLTEKWKRTVFAGKSKHRRFFFLVCRIFRTQSNFYFRSKNCFWRIKKFLAWQQKAQKTDGYNFFLIILRELLDQKNVFCGFFSSR